MKYPIATSAVIRRRDILKLSSLCVVPIAALLLTACGSDSTAPNEPVSVASLSPSSGLLAGGTTVTITGTNFIDVTDVTIGGIALGNRTVVSSTQITGTTPPATSTGPKDVVVTSNAHGSSVCSGCFSYKLVRTSQISAGSNHTCALTNAGTAYCWGSGYGGDLGNGSTANSYVAIPVSGGMTFTTIVAGGTHTCALTGAGDAYCWGLNYSGQLGTGTTDYSLVPVAVAGGLKFTTLAATGGDHTCGLVASGAAYCWGKNDAGQIGDGTTIGTSFPGRTTPVPVSGGLTFSDLNAGGYHTCGVTSGGPSYCWGLNHWGEIGNGLQGGNVLVPAAVSGGLPFTVIFAGIYHSCGLSSAGAAYCWGSNLRGQLGNGSASGPDNCPTYPNTGACSVRPVAVVGGFHFDVLAVGHSHTCGLVAGGVAYCWGLNSNGQLGDGTTTDASGPKAVAGGLTFKAISAGIGLYTCAITTAGAVYCWGRNDVGQLGNGGTNNSAMPVAVSGWPPQ